MRKVFTFLISLALLSVSFIGCNILPTKEENQQAVEDWLKEAYGEGFICTDMEEIDRNTCDYTFVNSSYPDINITARLVSKANKSEMSISQTVYSDLLPQVHAQKEREMYEAILDEFFDDYKVVTETQKRFYPVHILYTIENDGSEKKADTTNFECYKQLLKSTQYPPIEYKNETDVYFIVPEGSISNERTVKAIERHFEKNQYDLGAYICFIDPADVSSLDGYDKEFFHKSSWKDSFKYVEKMEINR